MREEIEHTLKTNKFCVHRKCCLSDMECFRLLRVANRESGEADGQVASEPRTQDRSYLSRMGT